MRTNQDWALNALRVIGELRSGLEEAHRAGWTERGLRDLEDDLFGEPDETANPEYPVEGTPLNPNEREEMERLLKGANESIQELYAVIAPLKDLGFEPLDEMGKFFGGSEQTEPWKRLGEVADRANEYFNGR